MSHDFSEKSQVILEDSGVAYESTPQDCDAMEETKNKEASEKEEIMQHLSGDKNNEDFDITGDLEENSDHWETNSLREDGERNQGNSTVNRDKDEESFGHDRTTSDVDITKDTANDSEECEEKEDVQVQLSESPGAVKHPNEGTEATDDLLKTKAGQLQCEQDPKEKALRFLEESGALRMFQMLAAGIVQDRPEKPLQYMINVLERKKKEKCKDFFS